MTYDQQTWANGPAGGTPLNEERLNHMEEGIAEAAEEAARAIPRSYHSFIDPLIGGHPDNADNTPALNTAFDMMGEKGGTLWVPSGVYLFDTQPNYVPGSVEIVGSGMSYSSEPDETDPSLGTVFRATDEMDRIIRLSDVGNSFGYQVGASIRDITVDGNELAHAAVVTAGRRNRVHNTYMLRGMDRGFDMQGQNGELTGYSVVDQRGVGTCVRVGPSPDNKILPGANIRTPGPGHAAIHLDLDATAYAGGLSSGNLQIQGIHLWAGANGLATAGEALIWIDLKNGANFANVAILNCVIEAIIGAQIKITSTGAAGPIAASVVRNVLISGNTFFNSLELTDVTYPVVQLAGDGSIVGFVMGPNIVHGGDATHRYKSLVDDSGVGSRSRAWMGGNIGDNVQYPVSHSNVGSTFVPEVSHNTVLTGAAITRRTKESGTVTLTGNGVASDFLVPTGLGSKITHWTVTPKTAGAAFRNYYVTTNGDVQLRIFFTDGAGAALAPGVGASMGFEYVVEGW